MLNNSRITGQRIWNVHALTVAVAAVAALAAWPPRAVQAGVGGAFTFRTGVVVDPASDVAYVMTDDEVLACIDLQSGAPLWEMLAPLRPLALSDGVLWAQAPADGAALRVVGLDVGTLEDSGDAFADAPPAVIAELDEALPADVEARFESTRSQRFDVSVLPVTNDQVYLRWTYQKLAKPQNASPDQQATNLRHDGLLKLASDRHRAGGPARLMAVTEEALITEQRAAWPKELAAAFAANELWPPVLRVETPGAPDAVWSAVQRSSEGSREFATLRRWRVTDGIALPPLLIAETPYTYRYPSADDRHLLVSAGTHALGLAPGAYVWKVLDTATGEVVAEFQFERPGVWFFLHDDLLIYETYEGGDRGENLTKRINAMSWRTGEQRWQVQFIDTSYRSVETPAQPPSAAPTATSQPTAGTAPESGGASQKVETKGGPGAAANQPPAAAPAGQGKSQPETKPAETKPVTAESDKAKSDTAKPDAATSATEGKAGGQTSTPGPDTTQPNSAPSGQ